MDNLNFPQSAALLGGFAVLEGFDAPTLRVKGKSGILHSMESRAAFWHDPTHRVVCYYPPKHASRRTPVEIWLSLLGRKLLTRGTLRSLDVRRDQIRDFLATYTRSRAKPITCTFTGLA